MNEAFDRALDEGLQRCPVRSHARFGPLTAELSFETDSARTEWTSALIAGDGHAVDFTTAFVTDPHAFDDLLASGRERSLYSDGERYSAYWQCAPINLLHLYDRQSRRGLTWMPTGRAPERIYSRPLLPILHAATLNTPWLPLHAAAVGRDGRFLTLAGGPGAGKTTASVACAAAGWAFAGDAFVLVHSEELLVEPLYVSARTRVTAPAAFEELIGRTTVATTDTDGDARHELRFADHEIGTRVSGGRIASWLLPDRRGAALPEFTPARARDGFGALMPVTTLHFPFGRQSMNEKLLRAIRKVPIFKVDTGNDPAAIPTAFETLLSELSLQ